MDHTTISWIDHLRVLATPAFFLFQIALIIHVVKTGRAYWWIWVIFLVPVIGAVAYVLVEILPELRQGGDHSFISSLKPRALIIKQLKEELAESDTVDRRLTLAHELFLHGKPQEAHDTAVEALEGVFHNDPHLLVQVARYKVELGRGAEALEVLGRIGGKIDKKLEREIALLRGRSYLLSGKTPEAIETFKQITGAYLGEEPRFYLGVGLAASGSQEEARALWKEIRTKFRKANALWRRAEKRWYKLAGEKLRATKT